MDDEPVITFFPDETPTLGNILVDKLEKNNDVYFASFKVPHPLTGGVEICTVSNSASDAIKQAATDALKELALFEKELKKAVEEK